MAKKRLHGEGSRVMKRKNGTFHAYVTVGFKEDGTPDRKYVYGRTHGEVRKKQDEIKHQLVSGTYTNTDLTVSTYLDKWLESMKTQVKVRTIEIYSGQAERHIKPRIGRLKLNKLNTLHIQTMCTEIAEQIGARTADLCRVQMMTSLKQAVAWQLISRNVAEGVKPFKVEKQEMQVWTPEEAVTFLDYAKPHRLYAAFYLVMATGLRRGELLAIRWKDVDFDSGLLSIKQSLSHAKKQFVFSKPKTNKGIRQLALSVDVLEELKEHKKRQEAEYKFLGFMPDHDLVFISEVGTPIVPRNFQRTWTNLKRDAGVRSIRLHDLRHLHVSFLVKKGIDLRTIADRVGHTNPSFTLDTYSHMLEGQRQLAAISLKEMLPESTPKTLN